MFSNSKPSREIDVFVNLVLSVIDRIETKIIVAMHVNFRNILSIYKVQIQLIEMIYKMANNGITI